MAEAQKDSEREGVASFKAGAETTAASEQEQVVMTVNLPMGKIVKEDIEVALEEAFEAGIAAALGEPFEDDQADEDDEEKAVRRYLIHRMLGRHPVQRRILQRVLVSRILRHRLLKRSLR
jgi:hypothetical protein